MKKLKVIDPRSTSQDNLTLFIENKTFAFAYDIMNFPWYWSNT